MSQAFTFKVVEAINALVEDKSSSDKPGEDKDLTDYCQTSEERQIVKLYRDGRDLNDTGLTILRRIRARQPNERKRLSDYNKVYSARKRRVDRGVWPASAPTASDMVALGLLDKASQYVTQTYVQSVDRYLDTIKPVISQRENVNVKQQAFTFTSINTDKHVETELECAIRLVHDKAKELVMLTEHLANLML